MLRNASFLIKPASSLCNMRCGYCFYTDEAANREFASLGIMSRETSRSLVKAAFEAVSPGGIVSFAFQGGEPTLAGLDYFRDFIKFEQEFKKPGVTVHHAIQTNGLLIDKEWVAFLKENNFLTGISIDGDKAVHDLHRVDASQKGTWNHVTKSFARLKSHGVDVNILCVVTGISAGKPQKIYNAFKKLGAEYLQFISCLDPLEEERGGQRYSLKPKAYGTFLCGLFDSWYLDWKSGRYVSIRLFEDYVHLLMGMPPSTCSTSGNCGSYFVVEGDGSLYPCDFYVLDEWKMGKIGEMPLEGVASGEVALRFLRESMRKPEACTECRFVRLCGGGCRRDRFSTEDSVKNYFCEAFKTFFSYAEVRLTEIAREEEAAMNRAGIRNKTLK